MLFLQKEKLNRPENRLIGKLKKPRFYKWIINYFSFFITVEKKFFTLVFKGVNKIIGVISVSTFSIFGVMFSYLDDFFVHKKRQGRGIGSKIFQNIIEKCKEKKVDCILLVTDAKRGKSHNLYKKFGFTLISFGLFFLAYKKLKYGKDE